MDETDTQQVRRTTDVPQIPRAETIDRAAILERIDGIDLPGRLQTLTAAYDRHVGTRDEFIWKWLYATLQEVTLESVPEASRQRLWTDKTVATIFVVVLDDLAEADGDMATFDEAAKVPFDHQTVNYDAPGVDSETVRFAERVWADVESSLREAPKYDAFADYLRFDTDQVLTANEYSRLVNDNVAAANLAELHNYDCHNMSMLVYLDADLMYAQGVDRTEVGAIREIVFLAQEIGRVGNWLTTWQREVTEDDYASGTVVRALENEVVTPSDVREIRHGDEEPTQLVNAIKANDVESWLYDDLERKFDELYRKAASVESVDMIAYADAIRQLHRHQLAAAGAK